MTKKYTLYDSSGRRIGEAREQDDSVEALVGCLLAAIFYALVISPIVIVWGAYKVRQEGWENLSWNFRLKWLLAVVVFGFVVIYLVTTQL